MRDKELNLVRNLLRLSLDSVLDVHQNEVIDLQNDSTVDSDDRLVYQCC